MKWMLIGLLLFVCKLEVGERTAPSSHPLEAEISMLNKKLKAQEELTIELILQNKGKEAVEFCLPVRSLLSKQKTPHVFVSLKSEEQLCGQQVYSRLSKLLPSKKGDLLRIGAGRKKKFRFNPLEILVDCDFEKGEGLQAGKYRIQIILSNSHDCFKSFDGWEGGAKFPILFRSQELEFEVL